MTYESETFDLVTSTDLMEHVENDLKGFGEIFRVLRPGGYYIFTVPFSTELKKTTIRAMRSSEGVINYFFEPEYHGDPFRGDRGIFTWRNYGMDLLDTLKKIGFEASVKKVYLKKLQEPMPIILAKKLL